MTEPAVPPRNLRPVEEPATEAQRLEVHLDHPAFGGVGGELRRLFGEPERPNLRLVDESWVHEGWVPAPPQPSRTTNSAESNDVMRSSERTRLRRLWLQRVQPRPSGERVRRLRRRWESARLGVTRSSSSLRLGWRLARDEAGAVTAEYAVLIIAAVAFAGLLVAILRSNEVRSMLLNLVQNALGSAG